MENQRNEFSALEQEAANIDVQQNVEPGPERPANEPPTAEMIYPIVAMVCDVVAPNWGIGDSEKKMLSEAYGVLLDKYFPGGIFGVELNALLVTAMVIAPRMHKPRIIIAEDKGAAVAGA